MMSYNTNQWLILQYPQAAGGKFLAACFMMFDCVTNWAKQPMSPNEIVSWYKDTLPVDQNWFNNEIDTPWVIPASRLWPRGADLSEVDFWTRFEPSPWFTDSWNNKKFIIDFWHKPERPSWWTNATWVDIFIDDTELYKRLLFSKVFSYNKETKTIIWNSQVPDVGRPEAIKNKAHFQNQWLWTDVVDLDDFYHNVVQQIDCFKWSHPTVTDKSIALSGLFDVDTLINFLLKFEDTFSSRLDTNCIKQLHAHWADATKKLL